MLAQGKIKNDRKELTILPTPASLSRALRTLATILPIEFSISFGTSLANTPKVSITLALNPASGKSRAVMSNGRS